MQTTTHMLSTTPSKLILGPSARLLAASRRKPVSCAQRPDHFTISRLDECHHTLLATTNRFTCCFWLNAGVSVSSFLISR